MHEGRILDCYAQLKDTITKHDETLKSPTKSVRSKAMILSRASQCHGPIRKPLFEKGQMGKFLFLPGDFSQAYDGAESPWTKGDTQE